MMVSTLSQAAEMMHGTLVGGDATFRGVSTDTRTLRAGELFVALEGPSFDGREFLSVAAERSAAGAVVRGSTQTAIANISVADTRVALGDLAAAWRRKMPARVVGLTGSNGKTTLKEMIRNCLSQVGRTLATAGNLNNDIGVPLMLLRMSADDEYGVFEMGANHAGEIAYLTNLVEPQVVAITNAAAAHLEGFGSLDGVARAKGEILQVEPRPQFAVLNADDAYFEFWRSLADDVVILGFGTSVRADVRATDIETTAVGSTFSLTLPDVTIRVELALPGRHNVLTAAAAAGVALALGVDSEQIRAGLAAIRPVEGRLKPLSLGERLTIYDDSYNANPASVIAAAEFLAAQPGESWFVLGDMAELGADAADLHAAAGEAIRAAAVDRMFCTGELARHSADGFGEGAQWFATQEALVTAIRAAIDAASDVNVLVKGSRSTGMERVVEALINGGGR